jgi:hypothetical protein
VKTAPPKRHQGVNKYNEQGKEVRCFSSTRYIIIFSIAGRNRFVTGVPWQFRAVEAGRVGTHARATGSIPANKAWRDSGLVFINGILVYLNTTCADDTKNRLKFNFLGIPIMYESKLPYL